MADCEAYVEDEGKCLFCGRAEYEHGGGTERRGSTVQFAQPQAVASAPTVKEDDGGRKKSVSKKKKKEESSSSEEESGGISHLRRYREDDTNAKGIRAPLRMGVKGSIYMEKLKKTQERLKIDDSDKITVKEHKNLKPNTADENQHYQETGGDISKKATKKGEFKGAHESMQCFICHQVAKNAVQSQCCHTNYCLSCIKNVAVRGAPCPRCETPIDMARDMQPNEMLRLASEGYWAKRYRLPGYEEPKLGGENRMMGMGDNQQGQIGLGKANNSGVNPVPRPIKEFARGVSQVACGDDHTLLLSDEGKVFAMGRGEDGALGNGTKEDQLEPQVVEALQDVEVRMIAAGGAMSLALTVEGRVYFWGSGGKNSGLSRSSKPKVVDTLEGKDIVRISVGTSHLAALASNGEVYTWGANGHGQLGHNNTASVKKPKVVDALRLKGVVARQVMTGDGFTVISENDAKEDMTQAEVSAMKEYVLTVKKEQEHKLEEAKSEIEFLLRENKKMQARISDYEKTIKDVYQRNEADYSRDTEAMAELEAEVQWLRQHGGGGGGARSKGDSMSKAIQNRLKEMKEHLLLKDKTMDAMKLDNQDLINRLVETEGERDELEIVVAQMKDQVEDAMRMKQSVLRDITAALGGELVKVEEGLIQAKNEFMDACERSFTFQEDFANGLQLAHKKELGHYKLMLAQAEDTKAALARELSRSKTDREALVLELIELGGLAAEEGMDSSNLAGGMNDPRNVAQRISNLEKQLVESQKVADEAAREARDLIQAIYDSGGNFGGGGGGGAGGIGGLKKNHSQGELEAIRNQLSDAHGTITKELEQEKVDIFAMAKRIKEMERQLARARNDHVNLEAVYEKLEQKLAIVRSTWAETHQNAADLHKRFNQEYDRLEVFLSAGFAHVIERQADTRSLRAQVTRDHRMIEDQLVEDESALDDCSAELENLKRHPEASSEKIMNQLRKRRKFMSNKVHESKKRKATVEVEMEQLAKDEIALGESIEMFKRVIQEAKELKADVDEIGMTNMEEETTAAINDIFQLWKQLRGATIHRLAKPTGEDDKEHELGELIRLSNGVIDEVISQGRNMAMKGQGDIEVRNKLSEMLIDNGELRKQINDYTEGLLFTAVERLENFKETQKSDGQREKGGRLSQLGSLATPGLGRLRRGSTVGTIASIASQGLADSDGEGAASSIGEAMAEAMKPKSLKDRFTQRRRAKNTVDKVVDGRKFVAGAESSAKVLKPNRKKFGRRGRSHSPSIVRDMGLGGDSD